MARDPNNGDLVLRFAAALFADGRCDTALVTARRGGELSPRNSLGPLVVGQCLEQAGRYPEAITTYNAFASLYPEAPGIGAVRGRVVLAQRAHATSIARRALAAEDSLSALTPDPETVGVLPLVVAGDSAYEPLSLGLAEIIRADLALLQRFRTVERLQLQALVNELALSTTDLVDQATAVRVGRLAQAGRLVQGTAAIQRLDETRLEASVVLRSGEVTGPASAEGDFRDLLVLEKELVLGIANALGYQLTVAERQRVLDNGTQRLAAFLAYASGLSAEERGDYRTAALHFAEAVRQDPGFGAAQERHAAAVGADIMTQATPSEITTVGTAVDAAMPSPGVVQVADAFVTAVIDVSGTQGESATAPGAGGLTTSTTVDPPPALPFTPRTITVIFRIPLP
ncbi:MAG: hypothetical protein OER90_12780 [Gemmatimonadota bacterium]|nr:hypothetical protein [Gemmatimonadota bacterium]